VNVDAVLVANPGVPVKTVKDLIALARKSSFRPGVKPE
jgi:hypothetical protein